MSKKSAVFFGILFISQLYYNKIILFCQQTCQQIKQVLTIKICSNKKTDCFLLTDCSDCNISEK